MGTKQYERIFQILGAVLLAAVVVGVIAVCFGNGARSGVKREIGASDYYSQEGDQCGDGYRAGVFRRSFSGMCDDVFPVR